MGRYDEDGLKAVDFFMSEADHDADRRLFGEPRRRKGRRGFTHPYSAEELMAQHIKRGGVSKDASALGRKLARILKK